MQQPDWRRFMTWMAGLGLIAILFRTVFFLFALRHIPFTWDEGWPSLMALHILKGEFPVIYWGQTYMGTQESYFQAACIALLGAKTWVVRLYPFLFGFGFVAAATLLADRLYGRRTALITLALLAIPVPYLTIGSVLIPPDNYLPMTALGTLALVLAHDLAFRENEPRRRVRKTFWLGFLLGYTFWLHILVLSYMGVAGLFLLWRNPRLAFRREGWAGLTGFVLGGLPLIIYNLLNGFATFRDVGGTTSWAHSWVLLQVLFRHTLHFLIGTKVMDFGDSAKFVPLPSVLAIAVAAVWILGLSLALVPILTGRAASPFAAATNGAQGTARPTHGVVGGTVMLVVMAGAAMFLFCRGDRSASQNVRYVLPIVSALPVLLAAGLDRILTRSRLVFGVLLAVVLTGQVWGNLTLARLWGDPVIVERDIHLPETGPVRDYLAGRGIQKAYANYWIAYRITFESGENIVCAEPYNQRFPGKPVKFLDSVQAATNVAYVYVTARDKDFSAEEFEEAMPKLGIVCTRTNIASFTVFHDFRIPGEEGVARWVEVPHKNWTVTTTVNGGEAGALHDGNIWTRWSLGAVQTPGAKVTVDMGAVRNVGRMRLDLGAWPTDFPRGYRIRTSVDGAVWSVATERGPLRWNLFWREHHPAFLSQKGDYMTLSFPASDARFVEIELTGASKRFGWSIAELRLFSPER